MAEIMIDEEELKESFTVEERDYYKNEKGIESSRCQSHEWEDLTKAFQSVAEELRTICAVIRDRNNKRIYTGAEFSINRQVVCEIFSRDYKPYWKIYSAEFEKFLLANYGYVFLHW